MRSSPRNPGSTNITLAKWRCSDDFRREQAKDAARADQPGIPQQSRRRAPPRRGDGASSYRDGEEIPLHIHQRGQLIHAVAGVMRIETADAAWIVPPALALWMPPAYPARHGDARASGDAHGLYRPGRVRRSADIADTCRDRRAAARADPGRSGRAARLRRSRPRRTDRAADPGRTRAACRTANCRSRCRATRVRCASPAPCSPDPDTARSRSMGGVRAAPAAARWRGCSARKPASAFANGARACARSTASRGCHRVEPVGVIAASVGYASPSAFTAMVRRNFGEPPRRLMRAQ